MSTLGIGSTQSLVWTVMLYIVGNDNIVDDIYVWDREGEKVGITNRGHKNSWCVLTRAICVNVKAQNIFNN